MSVKMKTDRHPHAIDATVGKARAHKGHPLAGRGAGNDEPSVPPVQAPAESAAEQYQAIAEVTADWAYALHIEADGRAITDWMSSNVQQVTGFTPSGLGSVDAWLRMVHRDDRELVRTHLRALQAGRADTVEYRVVTRSGETRWVRDYARPMAGPVHGAVQVVGGVRDITARRQAEMDRARLLAECELATEQKEQLVRAIGQAVRASETELRDSVAVLEQLSSIASADAGTLQTHGLRISKVAESLRALLDGLDELPEES